MCTNIYHFALFVVVGGKFTNYQIIKLWNYQIIKMIDILMGKLSND